MVKTPANAGLAFAACTSPRATAAISFAGAPRIGLQLVFEPGPGAEPDDRRQVERHDNRRRQFGKLGAQMGEHAPHAFDRERALGERGQA